jgi:hypothetical protein
MRKVSYWTIRNPSGILVDYQESYEDYQESYEDYQESYEESQVDFAERSDHQQADPLREAPP